MLPHKSALFNTHNDKDTYQVYVTPTILGITTRISVVIESMINEYSSLCSTTPIYCIIFLKKGQYCEKIVSCLLQKAGNDRIKTR